MCNNEQGFYDTNTKTVHTPGPWQQTGIQVNIKGTRMWTDIFNPASTLPECTWPMSF